MNVNDIPANCWTYSGFADEEARCAQKAVAYADGKATGDPAAWQRAYNEMYSVCVSSAVQGYCGDKGTTPVGNTPDKSASSNTALIVAGVAVLGLLGWLAVRRS